LATPKPGIHLERFLIMSTLFLIPTTLANEINQHVLLPQQLELIHHLQHFIVETPKIARQHLKQLNLSSALQQLSINELNKHNQNLDLLIKPLLLGHDMGLISDCGLPCVADPGSALVALAQKHEVNIYPLAGSSSIMLALMASGVNGQSFAFNGYLPIEHDLRATKIKELQNLVLEKHQTQIFIETPFRNQQLFTDLIKQLNSKIKLSMAVELMTTKQTVITKSISEWQAMTILPNIHKQEVVFVIGI
jgi:16S rRNA (cytidine1402-2'-O)-methyltransferase